MGAEGRSGWGWLTQGRLALLIIFLVLVIDQWIKIAVKTHMYLHESIRVTDWFYILFTENPGMAFGWEFFDKLFLTSFRIIAVVVIAYLLYRSIRKGVPTGFVVCLSLVLAGAAGNIIDCVFYGLIFNNPMPPQVATLFPPEGGYGTLFHGYVVDMLYFPLCDWYWPDWMPWIGGEHFVFFRPVFNLADAAISVGMVVLILFYSSQIGEVPWRKKSQLAADRKAEEEESGRSVDAGDKADAEK